MYSVCVVCIVYVLLCLAVCAVYLYNVVSTRPRSCWLYSSFTAKE